MTIANRVAAALLAMSNEDPESALHDICSAIEVTAANEAGRGGRRSYKDFIGDNFDLISRASFGVEGTLVVNNWPSLPISTMSVKVPPMSAATL